MPRFTIHMINSEFEASDDAEYDSVDHAIRAAVRTATQVGHEIVERGAEAATIELRIEQGGEVLARRIVNLTVSELR